MDADCWQEHAVNVTLDSMEGALNWIWDLKTTVPRSSTATVEGILKALADEHVSNFYLNMIAFYKKKLSRNRTSGA